MSAGNEEVETHNTVSVNKIDVGGTELKTVKAKLQFVPFEALIDTGAEVSVIS